MHRYAGGHWQWGWRVVFWEPFSGNYKRFFFETSLWFWLLKWYSYGEHGVMTKMCLLGIPMHEHWSRISFSISQMIIFIKLLRDPNNHFNSNKTVYLSHRIRIGQTSLKAKVREEQSRSVFFWFTAQTCFWVSVIHSKWLSSKRL